MRCRADRFKILNDIRVFFCVVFEISTVDFYFSTGKSVNLWDVKGVKVDHKLERVLHHT